MARVADSGGASGPATDHWTVTLHVPVHASAPLADKVQQAQKALQGLVDQLGAPAMASPAPAPATEPTVPAPHAGSGATEQSYGTLRNTMQLHATALQGLGPHIDTVVRQTATVGANALSSVQTTALGLDQTLRAADSLPTIQVQHSHRTTATLPPDTELTLTAEIHNALVSAEKTVKAAMTHAGYSQSKILALLREYDRMTLDVAAVVPYFEYYLAYNASKKIHSFGDKFGLPGQLLSHLATTPLTLVQLQGLGWDALIDKYKNVSGISSGEPVGDEGGPPKYISPFHSFLPGPLKGPKLHLPGIHDGHIDIEW